MTNPFLSKVFRRSCKHKISVSVVSFTSYGNMSDTSLRYYIKYPSSASSEVFIARINMKGPYYILEKNMSCEIKVFVTQKFT